MSQAALIEVAPSPAILPESSPLRRVMLEPQIEAPEQFVKAFDTRTLVYETFWHADGKRILLIGPPPLNLLSEWKAATYRALPSRTMLAARRYVSLSQQVTALDGAPEGTTHIELSFGPHVFELVVNRNLATEFAGRRVLFSMSQNNDLSWVRQWAAHHAKTQGTDAVVLFDNASTRYSPDDIAETLLGVPGLRTVSVPSWPWPFGFTDKRIKRDPFWAHFLQNCSMSVVLRRLGPEAHSLLNCDIDELAWAGPGRSVHDVCKTSRSGFITFKGQWVEPIASDGAPPDHRAFRVRKRDAAARYCRNSKWALDPARRWTERLALHPYWHWLEHRPWLSKERRKDVFYWHYRGINTNWKFQRAVQTIFDPAVHEIDPRFAEVPQ